jgi:hypothetical protein
LWNHYSVFDDKYIIEDKYIKLENYLTVLKSKKAKKLEESQFDRLLDVEILFHILLFIHKGIIKDILGTGAAIFDHPTFDALRKVLEKEDIHLVKGETVEEALENYSRLLQDSGLVKEVRFEKLEPNKYTLHINKCVYAKRLHRCLKPFLKGQTCRYALLATAIFQKFYGGQPKMAPSDFFEEGTKTVIEL